jgi:hypothetical protein
LHIGAVLAPKAWARHDLGSAMVCFCKHTMTHLQHVLPKLSATASASLSANLSTSSTVSAKASLAEPGLAALAAWLAKNGLPAAPWQPDPAWRNLQLPKLTLNASAVATLQAFAQLHTLAHALGMDLMVSAQATAFTRLAATLNARLSAMLAERAGPVRPAAWLKLSATLSASAQVSEALRLGLFPTAPALTMPPVGPPLSLWRAFLSELRTLLPVIAIANQLHLDLQASLSEQFAPIVRAMLRIPMPVMSANLALMAHLTAALSAIAQLRAALGIDPLEAGLPAMHAMVSERVSATATLVEKTTRMSLRELLALLPKIPVEYCPTLMAPPAVVNAAVSLNLPPLTWQVPPIARLPVLNVGLPVAAFCTQLKAAMNLQAALKPCALGCDAAKLLAAL